MAYAGSQLQVQIYVNRRQQELSQRILESLHSLASACPALQWVCPLESCCFAEYRDVAFLREVGFERLGAKLRGFWPPGGPRWDGLAIVHSAAGAQDPGVLLVEAKSHPSEVYGPGCRAASQSRRMIETALDQTKCWLRVPSEANWTGPLYQTANRLAHLYFLREVARVSAWYVGIYVLNDRSRPAFATTDEEWRAELRTIKERLQLPPRLPFAAEVFLAAKEREELLQVPSR